MTEKMTAIPGLGFVPLGRKLGIDVFQFADIRRRSSAAKIRTAHRYDFHMLVLVTSGAAIQFVDFAPVTCAEGTMLVLRPGQVHSFGDFHDWDGWLVLFRAEFLPTDSDNHTKDMPHQVLDRLANHQELDAIGFRIAKSAITAMSQDYRAEIANEGMLNAALFYQLSAMVLRLNLYRPQLPKDSNRVSFARSRFEKFREMLDLNFSRWHNVDDYARAMGCTQKSLNRATKAALDSTAKVFIAQRVTLEAKRLLVHTSLPIYTIGLDLGFDEHTNFSKFFRNQTGQSPLEFRKNYLRSAPGTTSGRV